MQRGLMVKRLLADAMEEEMLAKDIDSITVGDVIQRADVSRTTFYRHFTDKFDLINWIFGQYMDELTSAYQGSESYRTLLVQLLSFFRQKRNFFSKILNYLGQNSFYKYFLDRMTTLLTRYLQDNMDSRALSVADEYMIRYHCGGILRVTYDWLDAGCPETPEELTDILLGIASGGPRAYALPFFCGGRNDPDQGGQPPAR